MMTYAGKKQIMMIIKPGITYQNLVEALSPHLRINIRQNYIHVTMKIENSIGLSYKIQDDHDIQSIIELTMK